MAVDRDYTDQSMLPYEDYDDSPSMKKNISNDSWSCFGSLDSDSLLSSPMKSELGSTETARDQEEDYMAELSRQMAHYMFQDDDQQEKSRGWAVSPQSIFWSYESPQDPSREPSPPVPTMIEEFEKMKINKDIPYNYYSEIPSTVIKPKAEFQSKQALIDDQIRAIQFLKLKQEQAMTQLENQKQHKQYQNKRRISVGFNNGQKTTIPFLNPNSTPTPKSDTQQPQNQQQPSSGMRVVFLGGSGSKTKSSGTGVFFPEGIGYSSQTRKKQGCSTVLIPVRVVQALKEHFDKVGMPSKFNGRFPMQNDTLMGRNNSLYSQQQRQSGVVPSSNQQEMNLPQEWTY